MPSTSPSVMSNVCDIIGNRIPTNALKWNFEIKLFRENPHSLDPSSHSSSSTFLHTLTFSNSPKEILCLTKGVGTSFKGSFDQMLATKLQSLWQLRQTVRGEGTAFEMESGEHYIRLGNMMLQGNFRGLLIEVELPNRDSFWQEGEKEYDITQTEPFKRLKQIIDGLTAGGPLGKSNGKIIIGPPQVVKKNKPFSRVETAWQYVEALESR